MGDDAEAAAAAVPWLPPSTPAAGETLGEAPVESVPVALAVVLGVAPRVSELVGVPEMLAGELVMLAAALRDAVAAPALEPDGATLCVMLLVMFGPSERVTLGVPAGVLAAVPVADGTMLGATLCVMLAETLNVRVVVMVGVPAGVLAAVPVPVLAAVPVTDGSMLTVELGEGATLCVTLLVMPSASELVTLGVPLGVMLGVGVPEGVLAPLDVGVGAPEDVPDPPPPLVDAANAVAVCVGDTPLLAGETVAVGEPDAALAPLLATEAVAAGVPGSALDALAVAEVLEVAALEAAGEALRVSVLVGVPEEVTLTAVAEEGEATPP